MTSFIDCVIVDVAAGTGGDGCVSFRREKYVPRGGPDGGDGGKGGDVVFQVSDRISTLIDLHYRRIYRAGNAERGRGKSQKGKDGENVNILVPPGTVVKDLETGRILCELLENGERFLAARGGKGGRGNERFASARNRAPRKFTKGGAGEERRLELTLKLIADVGLVGEPNAGKSTLLGTVSAAHPKVAPYPFTTKKPVLGVVRVGEFDSFVMVDIPGLIEGAHEGKGMGRDFLRHIERCRILVYLVDVSTENPQASYEALRKEILHYDTAILEKRSVLVLTKCDLLTGGVKGVAPSLLGIHKTVIPISSVSGEGLDNLLSTIRSMLE